VACNIDDFWEPERRAGNLPLSLTGSEYWGRHAFWP